MTDGTTTVTEVDETQVPDQAAAIPTPDATVPAARPTVEQLLAQRDALTANQEISREDRDKEGRKIRRLLRAQGYYLRGPSPRAATAESEAAPESGEVPVPAANMADETADEAAVIEPEEVDEEMESEDEEESEEDEEEDEG